MKWIGAHIVDFIARFHSDVYLESVSDDTVADGKFLGLNSSGKIVKATAGSGSGGSGSGEILDLGERTTGSEILDIGQRV